MPTVPTRQSSQTNTTQAPTPRDLGTFNVPGAEAFGAVGADILSSQADLMQGLAQKEAETLERQANLRLETDLTEFRINSLSRVGEVARNRDPDEPLTEAVMNDFSQRAEEFTSRQPEFLRATAKTKLLPLQVSTARSAIAAQEEINREERSKALKAFQENASHEIFFNEATPESLAPRIQSFVENNIPADEQEETFNTLIESAQSNFYEQKKTLVDSPAKRRQMLQALQQGEFPGLTAKERRFEIEEFKEQVVKDAQKPAEARIKFANKVTTDPVAAAADYAWTHPAFPKPDSMSSTVYRQVVMRNPSMLESIYEANQVPEAQRTYIGKEEATQITAQLRAVAEEGDVDQFYDRFNEEMDALRNERRFQDGTRLPREDIVRGISQQTETNRAAFSLVAEVANRRDTVPTEVQRAYAQLAADPDAANSELNSLKELGIKPEALKRNVSAAIRETTILPQVKVMMASGMNVNDVSDRISMLNDAAALMAARKIKASGKNLVGSKGLFSGGSEIAEEDVLEDAKKAMDFTFEGDVFRTSGNDGYVLDPHLARRFSEDTLDGVKVSLLRDTGVREKLLLPFITEALGFASEEAFNERFPQARRVGGSLMGRAIDLGGSSGETMSNLSTGERAFLRNTGFAMSPDGKGLRLHIKDGTNGVVQPVEVVTEDEDGEPVRKPLTIPFSAMNDILVEEGEGASDEKVIQRLLEALK